MIRIFFIIISFIFLLNNAYAETFSVALKKAYNDNNELNAERESTVSYTHLTLPTICSV